MKIAIVFYSFSGNTRKACQFLKEKLSVKHQVELVELVLKEPETAFYSQCRAARGRETPDLANKDYDVSKYDFVVFASPVWAFTFTPALRTFLKLCSGLDNKKAAVFLTCGAAFSSGGALKELKAIVEGKKAKVQFSKYVKGTKTNNQEYLKDVFKDLLSALRNF